MDNVLKNQPSFVAGNISLKYINILNISEIYQRVCAHCVFNRGTGENQRGNRLELPCTSNTRSCSSNERCASVLSMFTRLFETLRGVDHFPVLGNNYPLEDLIIRE